MLKRKLRVFQPLAKFTVTLKVVLPLPALADIASRNAQPRPTTTYRANSQSFYHFGNSTLKFQGLYLSLCTVTCQTALCCIPLSLRTVRILKKKKTSIKLLSLEVSNPLERASVFHTSGAFVRTFIKYGYGSGEMFGYHGIAVHKDGFVLVCNIITDCQVR